MLMETAPKKTINDDFNIFYTMYKDLPVGAVLVNSGMTIISSNRRMCEYFSNYETGIDGLSVCRILNCCSGLCKCENSMPSIILITSGIGSPGLP